MNASRFIRIVRLVTFSLILSSACSRSNNLLFGTVRAEVAGHPVVVTDCYRTEVPVPKQAGQATSRYTPCRDADILIHEEQLVVNGTPYGVLRQGATVTVDHGLVLVNGQAASPAPAGK